MKIGIMGTGIVAQTLGGALIAKGHSVTFGTRDVKGTLAKTEKGGMGALPFAEFLKAHAGAKLETFAEAATYGEVVLNATSGSGALPAVQAAKDGLKGKILIDISNPLDFSKGFPPSLSICNTDSLGEQIQRAVPDAHVVKTLNTVNCFVMANPALIPGDHSLFFCANDAGAREKVSGYLHDWFGWKKQNLIMLGDITASRGTEMYLPMWVRLYGALQNPMFNIHVVTGPKPQG